MSELGGALAKVVLRNLLGNGVAALGGIVLARQLGARLWGAYAVSTFTMAVCEVLLDFGCVQFIIGAAPEQLKSAALKSLFAARLVLAAAAALFVVFLVAPFAARWYGEPALEALILAGFAGMSLASLAKPSLALLERDLRYGPVAALEVGATLAFYVPAASLALSGLGFQSLIVGELCRGVAALLALAIRPLPLGAAWDMPTLRAASRFGLGFVGSHGLWMLNSAVNPVVVGTFGGLQAAGYVRLAESLVTHLTFMVAAIQRLALPFYARARGSVTAVMANLDRLRSYQMLLGIVPASAFAALSGWILPAIFGPKWIPAATLLPYLVAGAAAASPFGTYSAALLAAGKSLEIARFHLAYGVALWSFALLLVPRLGYIGYGVACLVASASHLVIHRAFRRSFGTPRYRPFIAAALGCVVVMAAVRRLPDLTWALPTLLFLLAALIGISVPLRTALRELIRTRRIL